MKRLLFLLVLFSSLAMGQGENAVWLMGNQGLPYDKGKMTFDSSSYIYNKEFRKMAFRGTEATISDRNGNFLMSSNGVWIANATNDTMLNGGGLNPGPEVNGDPNGLLLPFANMFLPYPGDTSKYVLFHHVSLFDGVSYPVYEMLMSVIDITLDNGKGAVISKNDTVFKDTLNWGIGACRHANGRDWWIVMHENATDAIYTVLFTAQGIHSIQKQSLGVPLSWYNVSSYVFSPNGDHFAFTNSDSAVVNGYIYLFDFDRCNGQFSNTRIIPTSQNGFLWGVNFSPSGQFLYANTSGYLFQIDVNTLQIDTVATYDGYCYQYNPNNFLCTTFFNEYLAANGKIYITSGSTVFHLHEMNYPDSAGAACDLQQHAIFLDMFNFRAVPNHPNYHLGPVIGSVCDSLSVGQEEYYSQIQNFQISPNPLKDGPLQIIYLLPQNQSGIFEVYDLNGKIIYQQKLPPWSSMQSISFPNLRAGLYSCVIRSGGSVVSKKLLKM
jgi:hypothetical protein